MQSDQEVKAQFQAKNPWGLCTAIDLKKCNPATIRDAAKIKEFIIKLCDLIQMKRFGETTVVDFGEDERVSGFSMTQLIETSLVSGHFVNQDNSAYIDIFSCNCYPPYEAAQFTQEFFGAKAVKVQVLFRE